MLCQSHDNAECLTCILICEERIPGYHNSPGRRGHTQTLAIPPLDCLTRFILEPPRTPPGLIKMRHPSYQYRWHLASSRWSLNNEAKIILTYSGRGVGSGFDSSMVDCSSRSPSCTCRRTASSNERHTHTRSGRIESQRSSSHAKSSYQTVSGESIRT
mgnify:CR=1 FL=1